MRREEVELELFAMAIAEEMLREIGPWGPRCEEDLRDELMEELAGTRWARRRLRRWSCGDQGLREVMEDLDFGANEERLSKPATRRRPGRRRKPVPAT